MHPTTSHVRVRYAETDQMGVVHHANYLVWLEIGRVDCIRALGFDYKTLEQEHSLGIAVVDVHLRYKAPAHYDDHILVRTHLSQIRGSVLRFAYTVHRANPQEPEHLLAEGQTTHVVVTRAMQKARLPEAYSAAFRAAAAAAASSDRTPALAAAMSPDRSQS